MVTDKCFVITKKGSALIAKLLAGDTLHLTRVTVGAGEVPEDDSPAMLRDYTDLIQPMAQASASAPVVKPDTGGTGDRVDFTIEYRNDMNGGMSQGFWISELGVFAEDPDEGEVLIYYANLGLEKQYVSAVGNGIDVRRYPITFCIQTGQAVAADFTTALFMTEEDVHTCYTLHLLPQAEVKMDEKIGEHNLSPDAHPGILEVIASLLGRISLLELMADVGIGVRFLTTFAAEDEGSFIYAGIWNKAAGRIEF